MDCGNKQKQNDTYSPAEVLAGEADRASPPVLLPRPREKGPLDAFSRGQKSHTTDPAGTERYCEAA